VHFLLGQELSQSPQVLFLVLLELYLEPLVPFLEPLVPFLEPLVPFLELEIVMLGRLKTTVFDLYLHPR
jgi:hypothetical protein